MPEQTCERTGQDLPVLGRKRSEEVVPYLVEGSFHASQPPTGRRFREGRMTLAWIRED